MLTQRQVVPYLLQRKLISPKSVVEGDVMVVDASRRNRNFRVISSLGPSYLLKQGVEKGGIAAVSHEAAMYQFLGSGPTKIGIAPYLPVFYGYDPGEQVLILELLRDSENLREYHARRGQFSTLLASRVGNALGALHRSSRPTEWDQDSRTFEFPPPWVLSVHRPNLGILRDVSSANIQLIRIIQQFSEFSVFLDDLRDGWRTETLIHADVKWDNFITFARSGSERKSRLKLVDWELARVGDPCWDIGSVFNDYLGFWILSIPITGETPPDRFMELSRYPLERFQPAIRSFWLSYVRRMEFDPDQANEYLFRAVKYTAARLVQTGFEQMQTSAQLTGNIICLLQLSLNLMRRSEEAIDQLLGIPSSHTRMP